MPDLAPQSIPNPPPPIVTPPRIASTDWQDYPVFREAFLVYLEHEPLNSLFRRLGRILYDLILNYYHKWPDWPEGVTATELRAAVGDLRHLQGFLEGVGKEEEEATLGDPETALSRLAARQSRELSRVADEIETALGVALTDRRNLTNTPPPLEELFAITDGLPWPESARAARDWLIASWARGAGEGDGNKRLLAELRTLTDQAAFNFYHVLTLELLTVLREERGGVATLQRLGATGLAEHLLKAVGTPGAVVEHYRERLL